MPLVILLLMIGGALGVLLRRERVDPGSPAASGDAPMRMLRWATGLVPADRADWALAMLGELDRIEGRAQRRRFALGCLGAVALLPHRRRSLGPLVALVVVASGGMAVFDASFVRFGLDAGPFNWVMLGLLVALLAGLVLAVSVWLRQPGVAGPGLLAGLLDLAAWAALSGFTFGRFLGPTTMPKFLAMLVVPSVVGVYSTLQSRSSLVGRRAARLAGVVGGLGMFLLSTIAVLVLHGGPRDPGQSVSSGVSEALAIAGMASLLVLPLAAGIIGWAAAAVTARLRSA